MRSDAPLVIAGLGGSGTRGLAQVLEAHGVFTGQCFNPARDNLWFHFWAVDLVPFTRPELVRERLGRFLLRMRDPGAWDDAQRAATEAQRQSLKEQGIDIATRQNLQRAYESLLAEPGEEAMDPAARWGWKIPYCYLFADDIFELLPRARMLFLVRHPLDLAFSGNMNQLQRFGDWLGEQAVEASPRWQLKFCLKAYEHVGRLAATRPVRVVRFEELIQDRPRVIGEIAGFLDLELDRKKVNRCLRVPASIGRYRQHDLGQFDAADLERVQGFGYAI